MQETRETNGIGALYLGMLFLIAIVFLVVWCEYKSNHIATWIVLCVGGSVFWFVGFVFARCGASAAPKVKSELNGRLEDLCFTKFYLNGHFFQPYEQETLNGLKQFRLLATPDMSPEREAALIRYLINEGLTNKMWPQISQRIEEEADWAFFA
jgi:hypothetical protein